MIPDLTRIFADIGIPMGPAGGMDMNIRWSHRLSCQVRLGRDHWVFVKISPRPNCPALQNEATALRQVGHRLLDRVPKLLGFATMNECSYLVLSFLPGKPLRSFDHMVADPISIRAWEALFRDLGVADSTERTLQLGDPLRFLEAEMPALANYVQATAMSELLQRLPHVAQHGDLVSNNVAQHGTDVMVYDWEDFNILGLPGLDVGLFLGSLLGHSPSRITLALNDIGTRRTAVATWAKCVGLSVGEFRLLLPLYYGCFLWLKRERGYGEAIQKTLLHTIEGLLQYGEIGPMN